MKIVRVEIIGFGKLQNYSVAMDSQVTLFFGANEAGKSTLYQFIRTMLFGFPAKRGKVKDYEPKDGTSYGGRLILDKAPYGQVTIERIKSRNNGKATVLLADGQVGDETLLKTILAPLTRELFDEIFAIQQEQLPAIEKLEEKQLQNLLVTIGLTGSQKLLEQQGAFSQAQQKIYKPTGRNPLLNKKIDAYHALELQIKNRESLERNYQNRLNQLADIQQQQADNRKEYQQINERLRLNKEQQERWPLYLEQQGLVHQSPEDPKVLSKEVIDELTDSYQKFEFLNSERDRLTKIGLAHQQENVVSPSFLFYMQEEKQIQTVLENQMTVERLVQQQLWLQKNMVEKTQEYDRLREIYHWHPELIQQINEESVGEIRDLSQAQTELTAAQVALSEKIQQLKIKEAEVEAELNWLEEQTEADRKKLGREKSSDIFWLFPIVGAVVFWLVAKISQWALLGLWTVLAILIASAGPISYWLKSKKPQQKNQLKERWQTQLSQLDWLNEQIVAQKSALEQVEEDQIQLFTTTQKISAKYGLSLQQSPQEWLDSFDEMSRFRKIGTEITEGHEEITSIQEQLEAYQTERSFLKEWLPLSTAEHSDQYRMIQEFSKEMIAKKEKVNQNETGSLKWVSDLKEIEDRQNELEQQVRPQLITAGLSHVNQVPGITSKQAEQNSAQLRLKELNGLLGTTYHDNSDYQLETIMSEIEEQQVLAVAQETDYQELLKVEQKYQYEVKMMERDGTLASLYQEQANQLSSIQELVAEWTENRLAEKIMQDMLQFLSEQQLPALLATATAYFKLLTGGAYQKCFLQKDQLYVAHRNGQLFLPSELSTGTRDQLYLGLRLAFIQLHSQECSAPVIIDDGWLHFDQERKQALFRLVSQFSQQVQVICFSSDQEILAYFEEQGWTLVKLERGE